MLINTAVLYNDGHHKNHVFTYAMEHFKTSSLLQSFSIPA